MNSKKDRSTEDTETDSSETDSVESDTDETMAEISGTNVTIFYYNIALSMYI